MIMRVDILHSALEHAKCGNGTCRERVILTDPKGERYTQEKARALAKFDHLIIVCGHYEGIDARLENYVDESLSLGDFILTGGEIPAMAIVDSVVRLLPGVLPKGAAEEESFEKNLLEYPQYTRPFVFKGRKVPSILLSGNHGKIVSWQRQQRKAKKNYKPSFPITGGSK
jgi:tRNA (guanine37-N1)-methyltransferase